MMRKDPRAVDARTEREVPAAQFEAALKNFMKALGVDDESSFSLEVAPDRVVAKHVVYTRADNGVMSGDFWTEVINRDNGND